MFPAGLKEERLNDNTIFKIAQSVNVRNIMSWHLTLP